MMGAEQLNAWMSKHFTASAFRLETLQTYEVAADGSDYRRYLDGERSWTVERKQPWLDVLAAEKAAGRYRHRVRIVSRPVSDYTRYECEWGYAPNVAAGEDIRIIDLGERALPSGAGLVDGDWWFVTDAAEISRMVVMHYGPDGQFDGAEEATAATVERARAARDLLWSAAEPFGAWWERHHELHRDRVPAP